MRCAWLLLGVYATLVPAVIVSVPNALVQKSKSSGAVPAVPLGRR